MIFLSDHSSSESMVGAHSGDEVDVQEHESSDPEKHHVTGAASSNDPVETDLVPKQEPSGLPKQTPQDSQHEQMSDGHDQPSDSGYKSDSIGQPKPSQDEHNAPIIPHQASQDPSSSKTQPNIQNKPGQDSKEPDDGTCNGNDTGHTQDVPILSHQVEEPCGGSQEGAVPEPAREHQGLPTPNELPPAMPVQRQRQMANNGQDVANEDHQDPPRRPEQVPQNVQHHQPDVNRHQQPDERPPGIPQQRVQNALCCPWFLGAIFVLFAIIAGLYQQLPTMDLHCLPAMIWSTNAQLPKPIIEIYGKTHAAPTASSWKLQGKCKAYNASYTIRLCQWKQIHPLPTSPSNTVLPGGTKDCPHLTSSAHSPVHEVDASLQGLTVPTDLRTYTFELVCGHKVGNFASKRIEIWVNELIPPVISVATYKVTVSTSIGSAKLDVSCRAVQGRIVERKWEYIDGPVDLTTPSEDGIVNVSTPGIYKFKYRCTDSFGGTALRYACVNVLIAWVFYSRWEQQIFSPLVLRSNTNKSCTRVGSLHERFVDTYA